MTMNVPAGLLLDKPALADMGSLLFEAQNLLPIVHEDAALDRLTSILQELVRNLGGVDALLALEDELAKG